MRNSVCWFAVGILLALTPALEAQGVPPDTQSGNFLFSVPTGWNPVQQKEDTLLLMAPAPPPGTTTFIALSSHDLDRDLQTSFNELWGGFTSSYRILQGGQISSTHSGGYDAFFTAATAADQNGKQWTIVVLGAQYRNRLQAVMFISDVPPGTMLNAYEKVFQTFLANLSFGDALPGSKVPPANAQPGTGASAVAPEDKPHQLPPGALEGFYVGGDVGGYGGRVSMRSLYFSPDGWVVKIDLNNPMIGFDLAAYRNAKDTNRSWVGRYRVDGNDINILWQDYTDHREVVRRNEASAHPGLNAYVPTCRCTGKRFAGKYNWGLAGSGQYMQFFADGTFIDHGVTDQMLVPSPFYDHPRTQRGIYTIQSQTMIFNFADGHRGMRTFLAPKAQEKGQSFDWIFLGIQTLYEEHYQNQP